MGKGYRPGRLGEEIRRILSGMLLRGMKDPRLDNMVSITGVDVTLDGSYATVYFTVFDVNDAEAINGAEREERSEEVLDAMRSAKGLIKKEIGRQVKVRHIPELLFKADTSFDYGRHIEDLIRQTVKKDEEE